MKLTLSKSSSGNRKQKDNNKQQIGDIIDVNKIEQNKSNIFEDLFNWAISSFENKGHTLKQEQQCLALRRLTKNNNNELYQQNKPHLQQQQPQVLFPSIPAFNPLSNISYFLTIQTKQLVHSQCMNRLCHINRNSEQFILDILQKYAYQIEYTYSIGNILAHLSLIQSREYKVKQFIQTFPQVFMTRSIKINPQLKERKNMLVNFALRCISLHIGIMFSQLKQIHNPQRKNNNKKLNKYQYQRWIKLVQKLFSTLLFQFIPIQLSPCIIKMYLTNSNNFKTYSQKSLQQNNERSQSQFCLQSLINTYKSFFLLLISLFHYVCFMKKITNINDYYNILQSCYMGLIQWPIVIANSHQFQLPIIIKRQKEKHKKQ